MSKEDLDKEEMERLGTLLIKDIERKFGILRSDSDFIYELGDDIELLKKVSVILINSKETTNFIKEKKNV